MPIKSATDTCTNRGAAVSDGLVGCVRSRHRHVDSAFAFNPRSSANRAALRPLAFQASTISTHSFRERAGARLRLFAIAGR